MQIQAVHNQAFEAKQKFLSPNTHKQVKKLLNNMNSETMCKKKDYTFSSSILSCIKIGSGETYFYDGRVLADKAKDFFVGESNLEMGKVKLTINNATGEITKYKKPFFKSWKSVYKQACEVINCACKNFEIKKL